MKKIVSAFVLVFMFSVFSVTGFALIYEGEVVGTNYFVDCTSLDIFEKKNFGSESFHDQYFILPTEQYATFKIKFDNAEYLTDKFDIVFVAQRVIRKSGSTGFIPLPDGNQEKIIKTIHNVSRASLKDWYAINVVLKNYYPEFDDEFFRIKIGYVNQDENGNIPSSSDLNTQFHVFSFFNFTMGTPVDPPVPTNERRVCWTSFGNRTTSKGEYLNLGNSNINFKFYTGNIDNHNYETYIQEYNDYGQKVGDLMSINTELFSDNLKGDTTYNFSILLSNYVALYRGKNYVFNLVDLTTSEYVSSIGFSPFYDMPKVSILKPNVDNKVELEGDKTDNSIKPLDPHMSNGGSGGSVDIGDKFPTTGSISEQTSWLFNFIPRAIKKCLMVLTDLLNTVSNFCTTFVNFLGDMFPFLPPEIMACLSLSFVGIIVLRFLKR